VNAIQERLDFLTMPMLMAGSGVFGRGLGQTRFEALTSAIPDLLDRPEVQDDDIESMTKLFATVEGFAGVYAQQTASRFHKFRTLLLELDVKYINEPEVEKEEIENGLKGKNVVLTGFRDAKISDLLAASGGKLQSTVNGKTDILVIKDASSESAKSKAAREKGVEIMTREEFTERYF
jgi:NAD-dependent DNA ligase